MEQQRLSVAKAGIVTTLNTRTIVIATCNPRGKYDVSQDLSVNTSIGSPLLSRFDLILLLLDNSNKKVGMVDNAIDYYYYCYYYYCYCYCYCYYC